MKDTHAYVAASGEDNDLGVRPGAVVSCPLTGDEHEKPIGPKLLPIRIVFVLLIARDAGYWVR